MNKTIVYITSILLFGITAFTSYSFFSNNSHTLTIMRPVSDDYTAPSGDVAVSQKDMEGPKTEECPINGELLSKGYRTLWESRRPLGVMIENHTEARPQSGLQSADVVYEVVAEGGITRFLSVFYCKDAPYIGPVRSARMYFLSFVQAFGDHPLYAHVGGANTPGPADALGTISKMGWSGYNDLNQFSIPFPTFYRDYARLKDVATEHTMYSSTQKLWAYASKSRGLSDTDKSGEKWDSTFKPWTFVDTPAADFTEPAAKINYDFWEGRSDYSVGWIYDVAKKVYTRTNGGAPHIDKNSGEALVARTVAVVYIPESPANDGYPGGHRIYKTVGTGQGVVFEEGKAVSVTWKKPSDKDQIRLYTKNGKELSFIRGKIWFSILPKGDNSLTYSQ